LGAGVAAIATTPAPNCRARRAIVGFLGIATILVLSSCGSDPSRATAASPAQSFAKFAGGEPDGVPWADQVAYSINGVVVREVSAGTSMREKLSGCLPDTNEVEGHPCPASPLDTIGMSKGPLVFETFTPVHVGCNQFVSPKLPRGLTVTVIRPPESTRDCFTDYAVSLYSNKDDRIAWVDLSLSGP
jgi:hypothetical protein